MIGAAGSVLPEEFMEDWTGGGNFVEIGRASRIGRSGETRFLAEYPVEFCCVGVGETIDEGSTEENFSVVVIKNVHIIVCSLVFLVNSAHLLVFGGCGIGAMERRIAPIPLLETHRKEVLDQLRADGVTVKAGWKMALTTVFVMGAEPEA